MAVVEREDPPVFGDPLIDLFVYGDPVTQGSVFKQGGVYRNDHSEDLMWWRQRVEAGVRRSRAAGVATATGPVVATITFMTARPVTCPQWRKFPTERASSSARTGRRYGGDIDKLERALYDALAATESTGQTQALKGVRVTRGAEVMADDSLVIAHDVRKVIAPSNDESGVRVELWAVDPEAEKAGWVPVPSWPGWRYVSYADVVAH
jgi:hypothetical protein